MEQLFTIIQSLLQEEVTAVPIVKLIVAVLVACAAGALVASVYRVTFGGVLFSSQFALGLVLLSMITSIIILAISSNLVLSLGMVGALSIVRFRTAVKEPMDTVFMFWALASGILVGAGFFLISILATLIVGALFVLLHSVGRLFSPKNAYLLVLRYNPAGEASIRRELTRLPDAKVKSRRSNDNGEELVLELSISREQTKLLDALRCIPELKELNLVSTGGETIL